jgi:hypothetical protein
VSRAQMSGQIGHVLSRFIATANIIALGLFVAFPTRATVSNRVDPVLLFAIWCLASSLLLPAYVGVQIWRAKRTGSQSKPLATDLGFAVAWTVFFWGVSITNCFTTLQSKAD